MIPKTTEELLKLKQLINDADKICEETTMFLDGLNFVHGDNL